MSRRFHATRSKPFHRQVFPRRRHKGDGEMANTRVRCTFCRQYIPRDDVFLDAGIGRFCSSECVSDSQTAKARKAKDKVRQAKRRSQPKKTRHIPTEVRDVIHQRDARCRWCAGRGSQVHHIHYRSEGGPDEEKNLILLCHKCHEMVHSSKAVYKPLLLTYIWAYYGLHKQYLVPEIASALRRSGELTDLQMERLYGDEFAPAQ